LGGALAAESPRTKAGHGPPGERGTSPALHRSHPPQTSGQMTRVRSRHRRSSRQQYPGPYCWRGGARVGLVMPGPCRVEGHPPNGGPFQENHDLARRKSKRPGLCISRSRDLRPPAGRSPRGISLVRPANWPFSRRGGAIAASRACPRRLRQSTFPIMHACLQGRAGRATIAVRRTNLEGTTPRV